MIRAARLLLFVAAVVGAATGGSAPVAVAADSNTTTAVIVIDTGSSVRAVTVDVGSGMTGLAALQHVAAVATYGFAGQGGAVCSIDGVGNDATASACLVGPNSQYWAYFHSTNGATAWSYSPVGASNYTVHGGDVEGWRYGTGQKPGASAAFCDHVACPAPPAPTSPPGGSGGGTSSGGGGGTGAVGSSGSTGAASGGATNGSAGGSASAGGAATGQSGGSAGSADPQPTTATTVAPESGERDDRRNSKNGDGVSAEAASLSRGGSDDGSGSPAGVAIAGGLLAIVAGTAVWLRRRARAPG